MSFILDALKKSENERQRKAGPALYEVKLAPPRNRLPWWMIAVGALLGVNLIVVLWLLIRSPSTPPSAAVVPAAGPAAASVTAATATPPPARVSTAQQTPNPVMSAVPATPPAQTTASTISPANAAPTLNGMGTDAGTALAPDDLEPAVEPTVDPNEHVHTTTEAGIPSYLEAAAKNSRIPAMHLDFHLYAAKPQDRFVFINMKKLHEGDTTPEGVRVESINDEGAVLSFEGTRFTLLHE